MKSKEEIIKKKKKVETRKIKKGKPEYHYDMRQDILWSLYTDPRSETFNNVYQSALKAKYSAHTARNIGSEEWFINKVQMLREMMPLTESNIMEDLRLETKEPVLINQQIEYKVNPQLRKIRSEMTKFVASTVGRAKYHTKTEVETNNIISLVEGNPILDNLFKKK